MKNLNIIAAALASTVALASPVFAGWTKVTEAGGNTLYIDYGTVKENDGYVYYWEITDMLKPFESGVLSIKMLKEVDCDIPRKFQPLSLVFYKQPMAGGNGYSYNPPNEWTYPTPNTVGETLTNEACDYAGK